MQQQDISRIYFLILFLLATFLMVTFAWPFVHALVFGFILSAVLMPYSELLSKKLRISRLITSAVVILIFVLMMLTPLAILLYYSMLEFVSIFEWYNYFINSSPNSNVYFDLGFYDKLVKDYLAPYNIDLPERPVQDYVYSIANDLGKFIFTQFEYYVSKIFYILGNFFLMLLVMFGVMSYGYSLKAYILAMFPSNKHADVLMILDQFIKINRANVLINLFIGLLQGILSVPVFIFLGFDNPNFLGLLVAICSFVPLLGILAVFLPVAYIVFLQNNLFLALSIVLLAFMMSTFFDNFLKPKMIGNSIKINSLLLLLTIIGGISQFGLLGLFYGPITLIIFLTMVEIFNREIIKTEEGVQTKHDGLL